MQKEFIKRINILVLIIAILLSTINIELIAAETPRETQWSYSYTGNVQTFTAPENGTYLLEAYGASGGGANTEVGCGGYTSGEIKLLKGDVLYIHVGESGSIDGENNPATYNGGASSRYGETNDKIIHWRNGSGGGATDFRTKAGAWDNQDSLKSRVLVAGGGGGNVSLPYPSYCQNRDNYAVIKEISNGNSYTPRTNGMFGIGTTSQLNAGTHGDYTDEFAPAGGGGYYGGYSNHTYDQMVGCGGSSYTSNDIDNEKVVAGGHIGDGQASISYVGPIMSTLTIQTGTNGSYDGQSGNVEITKEYGTTLVLKESKRNGYIFRYYTDLGSDKHIEAGATYTFGVENTFLQANYKLDGLINISINEDKQIHVSAIDDNILKYYIFYNKKNGESEFNKTNTDGYSFDESLISEAYAYNGSYYVYNVKATGNYKLSCFGGSGVRANVPGSVRCEHCYRYYYHTNGSGSNGGKAEGTVKLRYGDTLYVYVGGAGTLSSGGYNGGGNSINGSYTYNKHNGCWDLIESAHGSESGNLWSKYAYSQSWGVNLGGGGGATDFRLNGASAGDRIIAAGGGASGGTINAGYYMDYTSGKGNRNAATTPDSVTTTSTGGNAVVNNSKNGSGGGGGGWNGGNAGYPGSNGFISSFTDTTSVYNTNAGNGSASLEFLDTDCKITAIDADFKVNPDDLLAPDKVSDIRIKGVTDDTVTIVYKEPQDYGDIYTYKVEAFEDGTDTKLYESNEITVDSKSGIAGYYYYISTSETDRGVTTSDTYTTDTTIVTERDTENIRYLHITAVDKQENMSDKTVFEIPLSAFIIYDKNDEEVNKYGDTVTTLATGNINAQELPAGTSVKVKYNKDNTELADVAYKKDGYVFKGWNTEPDGTGTVFEAEQLVEYTELIEKYGQMLYLYAQWEPITYTVKYNGNKNWNTSQTSYTQSMRFDKPETLLANKFKRTPNFTINGVELKQGYKFIGWAWKSDTTWTKKYKDLQGPEVFNMTTTDKDVINLYAIWEKPITLTFDMNGGYYNESADQIKLSAKIYNANYSYDFNINNTKRAKSTNNWTEQVGTIDAYGTIVENGMNNKYTKVDSDGKQYRFIGWSTNPNSKKPDGGLEPFVKKQSTYKIYDDTTLYAVWEPILQVQLQLDRTLGNLNESLPNRVVATAITENPEVALVIKPGEQGSYTVNSRGNITLTDVSFDRLITDIYDYQGGWTDNLNPNPTTSDDRRIDNIPLSQTHGLNRQPSVANGNSMVKKFYIPQYLGTKQLEGLEKITGKQHVGIDTYGVTFTFANTDSCYWKEVKKNPNGEQIQIKGYIYLPTKIGPDGKPSIPSILDELRSKLKIRLQ